MSKSEEDTVGAKTDLLSMTANIVSAFASHNQMAQAELSELIANVHGTLSGLADGSGSASESGDANSAPAVPAVPIDASVGRDAITCLECGKSFKTLKRHLSAEHDLRPEDYRLRWQLSKEYPLVAPSYSERRADTAKKIGLGRKPGKTTRKRKK